MSRPPGYVYEGVFSLYPGKSGWRNKVYRMPYHQVWGIYRDRILYPKMSKNLKQNSKVEQLWRDKEDTTTYHCNECGATYTRDNPDLRYCEFCNSKLEEETDQ